MKLRLVAACVPFLLFQGSLVAAEYGTGVTAKVVLKTTTTSNGEKASYLTTDRPEITAMTVEIAPGAETGWHSHPVPVYAWVVAGSVTIEMQGGTSHTYSSGDAIVEAVNTPHDGRNAGTETVRLLVFYAGAEGKPNVARTEKSRELPAATPPAASPR